MNRKIEELLGQAYDQAVPETWTTLSSEQLGRIYDKFAELIVQECADVCERFGESGDGYTCSAEILEHFGVEE